MGRKLAVLESNHGASYPTETTTINAVLPLTEGPTYEIHSLHILRAEFAATGCSTENGLCDGENATTATRVPSSLREFREHTFDIAMAESLV